MAKHSEITEVVIVVGYKKDKTELEKRKIKKIGEKYWNGNK